MLRGVVVFDLNIQPHHHFIDEEPGEVFDMPWDTVRVTGEKSLEEFEVREYQVVMRAGGERSASFFFCLMWTFSKNVICLYRDKFRK